MNRKITVSVALAITIIAMTVTFAITWLLSMNTFDNTVSAVTQLQAQYTKLAEIDTYVRGNYYGDIDDDTLFDRVANGYMNGLGDRYSTYYTEKEYTELVNIENGTLVGAGLEVVRDVDGRFQIVRVYPDSPAEKAGVEVRGYITAIDGVETRTLTNMAQFRSAIMGEVGTDLTLDCLYNVADAATFTIRRTSYRAPTVETIVGGDYAYIRISAFTSNTFSDFDYSLRQAQNAGVKGIVFDVRGNNSSTFNDDLYKVIDMLAPRGTVAKSVNKTGTERVLATSDENYLALPMVVLVNEATAGPAELFAASLRELCGSQVVGATTAGRGTIQRSPYRLQDGSAVSVTVAMLYTGGGESFDGTGIAPDDVVEGVDITEAMLLNPQLAIDQRDNQIMRAFQVLYAMVREAGGAQGQAFADGSSRPAGDDGSSSLPQDDSSLAGDDSSVAPQDDSTTNDTTDDKNTDSSVSQRG